MADAWWLYLLALLMTGGLAIVVAELIRHARRSDGHAVRRLAIVAAFMVGLILAMVGQAARSGASQ